MNRNGVLGRGCDEAEISEEKRLFTEWGPGIQWMKASVRNSTGKAIQWRGFGHSVNRRTLKIEIFCAHPLPKWCRTPAHHWMKNPVPMGPEIYPVLGQGSAGRLLGHCQIPVLCWLNFSLSSADCKRGRRKGATSKNVKIVKKCQKVFRHFSTLFAQGKKRQKSSKNVKKFFDTFRQISRGTIFPAPFGGLCCQHPRTLGVTLLVDIEMSFLGYRHFSIFFSVPIFLTSNLQDVEAKKSTHGLIQKTI